MTYALIEQHFQENKDRIRIREEASNGSWMAINRGPLTRFAYRLLHNWEDAEDCVQEAYCRALQYINTFKEGSSFDNWMFIILARVVSRMVTEGRSAPTMVEADEELHVEEFLQESYTPESFVLLEEWTDRVERRCFRLSKRDADIIKLYFVYGHLMREIADILDVNIQTVSYVIQSNRSLLEIKERKEK